MRIYKFKKKSKLSKNIINKIRKFIIDEKRGKAGIASPITGLDPVNNKELYVAVENIFNVALPMLSNLKRPGLILPGKLQVVIKAQQIYLKSSIPLRRVDYGNHEDPPM